MTGGARTRTRDIARAAVRAELGQVAFDLFRQQGFDRVTINDIAAAAGVSRNTFLRYFGTKEDAVLGSFETRGGEVADAIRARPVDESDWTAIRRSFDGVVEEYRADRESALAVARLIRETPALRARVLDKQCSWRPLLAEALAGRAGEAGSASLEMVVRAAAALDCLDVAVEEWAAQEGRPDLGDLLDRAFQALAAR
ncbi:TetR family transcriptional regulator [Streptomyces sp. NPDC090075]|uniref:TetR family transcriptional regulator n=1 Tax=Streptomyces sp. NPDC090075 TaxID=3365937 RepID=UPI0038224DD5